ncbi:unnamed protein product [Oppiella nova]|uniref:Uncharacterized protein n=1 Tax=Oppiella nova TaxID=334625 RepID=A0A7R9QBR1_9ACAR|nr:unnamed protein product [Oppiella nova]CAG2162069.1 unnamed protein product [Oppiella nova]
MEIKVNKICEICSDKGIGRHFGAITCEPCKGFFRRNANKEQVIEKISGVPFGWKVQNKYKHWRNANKEQLVECPSDGKCKIMGMKKELILSDEEREQRRRVVEENRRKRQLNESQTLSSKVNKSSNPASIVSTISDDSFLGDITDSVLDVTDEDLSAQIMEIENYVNSEDTDQSIETLGERLMLKEIRQRAQKIAVIPMFKELTDYNGLNALEVNKIGELLTTSKIFDYPATKNTIIIKEKADYMRIFSKRTDESIKEALNYCKGLTGFTSACAEDQFTLFKIGCVEMMLLRALMFYNEDEKYFKLIMISAIALFNPNRPNLKHRHNIRYLLLKCRSDCESQERLCQLMNTFADIYKMLELQKTLDYEELKGYVKHSGPLIKEIYDVPAQE